MMDSVFKRAEPVIAVAFVRPRAEFEEQLDQFVTRYYRTFYQFVGKELNRIARGPKRLPEQTITVGSVIGIGAALEKDAQRCGASKTHSHFHKTKLMPAIITQVWVAAFSQPVLKENCVVATESESHLPTYRSFILVNRCHRVAGLPGQPKMLNVQYRLRQQS